MFNYLRIISLIGLCIVAGMTIVGGTWFRSSATEDLRRMFEESNAALAQGYINSVWHPNREAILPLTEGSPAALRSSPAVATFASETMRYFKKMPLVRVNFYVSSGKLLMSGNISKITNIPASPASPDVSFAQSNVKAYSHSSQMVSVEREERETVLLLQTIVPIRAPGAAGGAPSEGALELLYDVTGVVDQLWYFQLYGTFAILLVFFVFLFVLSITSKRAETIISKQHEANIELAAEAAAAQAQTEQKSQFLANISHELRTPLNAIIGFSEIIKNEVIATIHDQKYHTYINDINSAGVHLLSLINDILDFSKAEAGKLELDVSEINVNKTVQNCLRLVMPRAEAGNVQLIDMMPKDHSTIITDSKKFKQIILNLLSNAVKFTPDGGSVTVKMWRDITNNSCTFEISDTGIGIAPKDISKAMSPFGQIDNTLKRKYEGTGLGLPLTKKLVELMGGKFSIESVVGEGTTISFSLPNEIKPHDDVIVKTES
jgi:two-component system cell cycle sensor histidine kinase PleC